jgi:type II secretory pathway component PulM
MDMDTRDRLMLAAGAVLVAALIYLAAFADSLYRSIGL